MSRSRRMLLGYLCARFGILNRMLQRRTQQITVNTEDILGLSRSWRRECFLVDSYISIPRAGFTCIVINLCVLDTASRLSCTDINVPALDYKLLCQFREFGICPDSEGDICQRSSRKNRNAMRRCLTNSIILLTAFVDLFGKPFGTPFGKRCFIDSRLATSGISSGRFCSGILSRENAIVWYNAVDSLPCDGSLLIVHQRPSAPS
ncbi:hypothetical protein MRB53_039989 [Persea americana]|nr:hypothetical protein MRB53_039989 [Persea americana]